jgi:hypothetical protein
LPARFEACFIVKKISANSNGYSEKCLRSHLVFFAKYQLDISRREGLAAFLQKLRDKKQMEMQQQQASHPVL